MFRRPNRPAGLIAAGLGVALIALGAPVAGSAAPDPLPPFRAVVRPVSAAERADMVPSVWRAGCPVPIAKLRHVSLPFVDFAGRVRRGALVVHNDAARDVIAVFRRLYAARFPIRSMRPIQRYGGDDFRSIEADNTSAFNCRPATGSGSWSQHAYGRAIDINPLENPYVYGDGTTSHPRSERYLRRSPYRRGMAVEGRVLVRAFDSVGWTWGGRWESPKDYQHFSAS